MGLLCGRIIIKHRILTLDHYSTLSSFVLFASRQKVRKEEERSVLSQAKIVCLMVAISRQSKSTPNLKV
jgi:hypothetical protein